MKTTQKLFLVAIISVVVSCKKDNTTTTNPTPVTATDNYSFTQDFFSDNYVVMQAYTINAGTGGSFTSPQGTIVTIPANAFVTKSNIPVTGNVTIQFKDLYKKSDMFLINKVTEMYGGAPLKSGGEFFIKAVQNNSTVILASGKSIDVSQPASLTGGINGAFPQKPFVSLDTFICGTVGPCMPSTQWFPTNIDSVQTIAQNYIYNLYHFNSPVDSGSWCNSDNSTFFASYPQTTLTLLAQDTASTYGTEVFLFFKNLASVVHVYNYGYENYKYSYAPQGLQCTAVAIGVKGGKLYSAFVPITIGVNQTIPFTLSQTTTSAFVAQVKTLD